MNRHVNSIAGRLSLRHPQRHSLEILDRVTEIERGIFLARSFFPDLAYNERGNEVTISISLG